MNSRNNLIVYAEDEPDLRELVAMELTGYGFKVIEVADGQECLDALVRVRPDLILLDVDMPRVTGIEVLQAVRRDLKLKNIPVVMLSAYADAETVRKFNELGATDHVAKPFNFKELPTRLRSNIFDARKIHKILSHLNTPESSFFKTNSGNEFFDVYQVKSGKQQLAVFLPKDISVAEAMYSQKNMESMVSVFVKNTQSWQMIWPVGESEGASVLPGPAVLDSAS